MGSRYGISVLFPGVDPIVDIVAVHGLNGHPLKTWTSEKSNICWLNDDEMLSKALPNARVMTWGYNADVAHVFGSASSDTILLHSHTLVTQLTGKRSVDNTSTRPIIFICHSLGGIIVKQALAHSESRKSQHVQHEHSIYTSTYGILFLGTPHEGTDVASMFGMAQRLVGAVVPKKIVDTDNQLLNALKHGSEILQVINAQFAPLMKEFRVFFFWEEQKTRLPHTQTLIVSQLSAAPLLADAERCGIAANHSQMCKFEDSESIAYQVIVAAFMRYSRDAPKSVEFRTVEATKMINQKRINEALMLSPR